jgi:hypothetical protein
MNGRNIVTTRICPPIPDRRFDWSAHFDDYDADCGQDGYYSLDPVGYGATEKEAVEDLLEQAD